ncbi:MAG: S-layer homology domain-containing protein [Erysipelotrichaceae bacterium]|nr:S-layer homology domain-containing protein [Erysipelotrichaceae bacterium]
MRLGKKLLSVIVSIALMVTFFPTNPYRINAEEDEPVVAEYNDTAEVVEAEEEELLEDAVEVYAEEEDLEEIPQVEAVAETPEVEVNASGDRAVEDGLKVYFSISSALQNNGGTTTVEGSVDENYFGKLVLPNKDVNAENATVTLIMQNIGSLGITDKREATYTIHTNLTRQMNLYQALAGLAGAVNSEEALFGFKDATLNVTIRSGKEKKNVTYNLAGSTFDGTQAEKTITAEADPETARAAWNFLVNSNNFTAATKDDNDSYVLIKNGSTLQIGKELLQFETSGDLLLDNLYQVEALNQLIRDKLQVVPAEDSAVTFTVKKGSKLAVSNSYIESKEDITVTIDVDADDLKILSTLRASTDTNSLVKGILVIMNECVALLDNTDDVAVTIDVGEVEEEEVPSLEEDVKFRVKVSSDAGNYGTGSVTGTVYNDYSADVVIGGTHASTTNVTLEAWMQNVLSLGVGSLRYYKTTVHPDPNGGPHSLATIAQIFRPLVGENTKIVANVDDLSTTYTVTSNGMKITATPDENVSDVWHAIVNAENMKYGTQEEDSYIVIANGSYIRVADKKLEFESDQDLKLDDFSQLGTLPATVKDAVKLTEGLEEIEGIEFYLEPGTTLAVGESYVTLQKDAKITTDLEGTGFAASLKKLQQAGTVNEYISGLFEALGNAVYAAAGKTTTVNFVFGHVYGETEPTWTWTETEDGWSAKAVFVCDNNNTHAETKEVEANVVLSESTEAGYVNGGSKTYTATVEYEGNTYTDEKVVEVEPIDYKFVMEVSSESNEGTTGKVTGIVNSDYVAKLIIGEGTVNTSNVTFGFWMKNVASLGVSDPRHYERTLKLAESGKDVSLDVIVQLFSGLQTATVIGEIGDDSTTYSVVNSGREITATPDGNASTVWHAIVKDTNITYGTQAEDSSITLKKGSFVQIADRLLTVDKDLVIDNLDDLSTLEKTIRDAVTLNIADEKADVIILYLEPGSQLAMGSSYVSLNEDRDLLVTIDVADFDEGTLSKKLDELRSDRTIYEMIKTVFGAAENIMRAMNGNTTTVTFEFGHKYSGEEIEWVWADDYSSATALISCDNNADHDKLEVEAQVTDGEVVEATCEEDGTAVHIATIEYEGETYTDEQVEVLKAEGHSYGEPEWTWADDYSTATAVFTCSVCDHTETIVVEAVSDITPATCEEDGVAVYTATLTADESPDGKEHVETKTIETKATGHDYKFVDFTWTETTDGQSAVANYECQNNTEHKATKDATVEKTGNPATCEADGKIIYIATVTAEDSYDGIKHVDTLVVEEKALGHDYGDPVYKWSDDNSQVTATIVCNNDNSHVITETVSTTSVTTEPTYNTEGKIVYTAEFESELFETQTKEVILEAKGIKIVHQEPFPVEENTKQLHLEDEENIDLSDIVWTSSDPTVATVDENGVVTGIKAGRIYVTASTSDGKYSDTDELCIQFSDVTDNSRYFYYPVYWALDNGITTGTNPTTFSPMSNCTRAQVVTFLWRLMGEPKVDAENQFTDVKEGRYFYKAVQWAYSTDITTGVNSSEFGVKSTCTRGMIVTFLKRYNDYYSMLPPIDHTHN